MASRAIRLCCYAVAPLIALAGCGGDDDDANASANATVPTADGTVATTVVATTAPATSAPSTASSMTTIPTSELVTVPSTADVQTADELLSQLSDDDIASVGGLACATELVTVVVAGDQYIADTGTEPQSLDVLFDGGYLTEDLLLWKFENNSLRPVEGSGCIDLNTSSCVDEAGSITIARLAYLAAHPGEAEPTMDDLVLEGLTGSPSDAVDLVDGEVVAVAGGPCEGIDLTIDWPQECESARKTNEVAAEAYNAQNGSYPATDADVVPDFLR